MKIQSPSDSELFYGGYLKGLELLIKDYHSRGNEPSEIAFLADSLALAQSWGRSKMQAEHDRMAAVAPAAHKLCITRGREMYAEFCQEPEPDAQPVTLEQLHGGLVMHCESVAEQIKGQADPEAAVELQRIEELLPRLRASDAKTAAKAFQWLSEHDPEMVRAAITHALDLRDELARLAEL
jgi:hypothetical protein